MKRFLKFAAVTVAALAMNGSALYADEVTPLYANHNRVPGNTPTMTNIQAWASSLIAASGISASTATNIAYRVSSNVVDTALTPVTNDLASLAYGVDTLSTNVYTKAASDGRYLKLTGGTITGSLAQGDGSCTASGDYSHAEGYYTTASGNYSHAEGYYTTASGYGSHAEGYYTTASGESSHAEGTYTTASGDGSHAEGYYATASGSYSHADGYYAAANGNYSFAWNGDEDNESYTSHGTGTFNINPAGGLAGLYIGETNFVGHVTNIVNGKISPNDATFSNAVLSVGLNIDTNSVAVLNEIASTFGGFPITGTATTLGGLLAALAAAISWLKKNKVGSFSAVGTQTPTVSNGVADLSSLFTSDNTSLNAAIDAEIAARCASLDPAKSSIKDIIKALKGNN